MIPAKLKPGDEIRVVSPAVSLSFIPEEQRRLARERWERLGLRCSFSANSWVMDRFDSSPVEARVSDLHEAFADPGVKGMLTTLGGYNSNGLLDRLDYGLIRANPKVLSGFSDITALATAIYARTGLVTYSGPHFSTFGMLHGLEYTREFISGASCRRSPSRCRPPTTGATIPGTRFRKTGTSSPTRDTRPSTKARRRAGCWGKPRHSMPPVRDLFHAGP